MQRHIEQEVEASTDLSKRLEELQLPVGADELSEGIELLSLTVLCESIAKIKIKRASPRMRLLYKNASTTTKNKSYFIKLVDRTIK